MAKFRLACHLIQFAGEDRENPEKVFREVAEAGWAAIEGQVVRNADEMVELATKARSFGLHIVNLLGARDAGVDKAAIDTIKFNITLGNDAAEIPTRQRKDFGGPSPSDADFQRAARSMDQALAFAKRHAMKGFHHAHLGTMIETVEDAECLLTAAPDLWLLLDTGHFLACGSDPMRVFESDILRNRIGHVHLKDCHADDPATWDHRTQGFGERARFAELGQGNLGFDVRVFLEALEQAGYDGWVSVELDRPYPPRPAAEAARVNREYLHRLGC